MLTCPLCKKRTPALERECPSCRADLSLLVHYVESLAGGLARAEALTRAGQLGEAVWAYLEVLEVDPDNETARRQVGRVAAAVRQFDEVSARRRLKDLRRQSRLRRWLASVDGEKGQARLGLRGPWGTALLLLAALLLGFVLGRQVEKAVSSPPAQTSSR